MKPILFSTPMVQAILSGTKTQTRRIIRPQPCQEATKFNKFIYSDDTGWEARFANDSSPAVCDRKVHIVIGHTLWVRETWERFDCSCCEGDYYTGECFSVPDKNEGCYLYKASHEIRGDARWHPSIHMPREAARIFLRVTDVRVERVQELSVDDCIEEGVEVEWSESLPKPSYMSLAYAERRVKPAFQTAYRELWDSLNAKRGYSWTANPWVWVYKFVRVDLEGGADE